jgi:hypothetical protein
VSTNAGKLKPPIRFLHNSLHQLNGRPATGPVTLFASQLDTAELRKQKNAICGSSWPCAEYSKKAQAVYFKHRPVIYYFKALFVDIAFREKINILFETTGKSLRHLNDLIQKAHFEGYQVRKGFICFIIRAVF